MRQIVIDGLLKAIDPTLVFQEDLYDYVPRFVLKVEKGGTLYVLKAFNSSDEWEKDHITTEVRGLELARDVGGITHLVHNYGTICGYNAILKEYREGRQPLRGELQSRSLQRQLEDTITQLHERGLAKLEVAKRNIIIAPDRQRVSIIDLGSCLFHDEMSPSLFEDWKEMDWQMYRNVIG